MGPRPEERLESLLVAQNRLLEKFSALNYLGRLHIGMDGDEKEGHMTPSAHFL